MREMTMNPDRSRFAATERALPSSMWHATAGPMVETPALSGDRTAEVLVIGGGFNGLTAALRLAEQGADAVLLEAGEIGEGASGRNAGMVNPGQFLGPAEIAKVLGADFGEVFLRELGGAPALVADLIKRHGIECHADFRPVIRAAHDTASAAMLDEQSRQWASRGEPVEMVRGTDLKALTGSGRWDAAMLDRRGFTIQPLAYARGLARAAIKAGAQLYQGVRVSGLKRENGLWIARTQLGVQVKARGVILSTNAYTGSLHPAFSETLVTSGAFGVATRPLDSKARAMVLPQGHSLYDTHKIPLFFRYDPAGRLMVGSLGFLPDGAQRPEAWAKRALRRLWPDLPDPGWSHVWQGTLGLTSHHMPRLISPEEGLVGTIGCNGRGIAPNSYFGAMLADLVLKKTVPLPLPIEAEAPQFMRTLRRDTLDLAMRLYRNTTLLN